MNRQKNFRLVYLFFLLFAQSATATDVNVIGLFPNKAVVVINGSNPKTLGIGQSTREGVKLISSDDQGALLEIDGKRETLKMGQHVSTAAADSGTANTVLTADGQGHFITLGSINGASARFLVDTGASYVSMGSNEARRLGIDYRKGQRGNMSTANGVVASYKVVLNNVRVGDITLNQVDASVSEGAFPDVVLLGMSFLNRVEMKRDAGTMMLTKRY